MLLFPFESLCKNEHIFIQLNSRPLTSRKLVSLKTLLFLRTCRRSFFIIQFVLQKSSVAAGLSAFVTRLHTKVLLFTKFDKEKEWGKE